MRQIGSFPTFLNTAYVKVAGIVRFFNLPSSRVAKFCSESTTPSPPPGGLNILADPPRYDEVPIDGETG